MGNWLKGVAVVATLLFDPGHANAFGFVDVLYPYGAYDAGTNVFDMSVTSSYLLVRGQGGCGVVAGCVYFSGEQILQIQIDESGSVQNGVFTLRGAIPQFGIDTPQLLISGVATGGSGSVVSASDCVSPNPCAPHAPVGSQQGILTFSFRLDTVWAHSAIRPFWGTEMAISFTQAFTGCHLFVAYPCAPFPSSPLTNETLWQYDWAVSTYDYWILSARGNTLPEPRAPALIGLGLAGLGLSRRRKAN